MKRWALLITILLFAWLATGFFAVPGNERAVVRRFGKVVRNPAGRAELLGSGLHWDLPRPFARVDRVNLNEVRTLSVGSADEDELTGGGFLRPAGASESAQFLTGDKNILNIKIDVQYRVSEEHVDRYLYALESPETRLKLLAGSVLADYVARAGVDYVHTLGRSELQQLLTERTRELAESHELGLEVDTVTLDAVHPPLRVKAAFLDVSNARADKEQYIHTAASYHEERLQAARAQAQQIIDEALVYREERLEQARAAAESFVRLIEQFRRDERNGVQTYAAARSIAVRRRYLEAMEDILRRVKGKVLLDSGRPVDLTIFRDPKE